MSKDKGGTLAGFIKNSGIFFIGSCLSKLIVFFLLPLYTGVIPTADYGYYDLSVVYVTLLSSLIFFDVWVSAMRFIYERRDENDRRQVIHSAIRAFGLSSLIFTVLGIAAGMIFSLKYTGLIIAHGLTLNLSNLYTFIARGHRRNIEFALSGIINTVVLTGTNILLLGYLDWDFSSLYVAAIAGHLVQCVFLEWRVGLRYSLPARYYDKELLLRMVRFSLPLCLNSVAYWLLNSFSRIVLERVCSLEANGIYAVGNKFGAAIWLATTCFTYAWQDLSFKRDPKDKSNGAFFSFATEQYMQFLLLCMAIVMPVIGVMFPIMVRGEYVEAYGTIPLFLLVSVLAAVSSFMCNIFYAINDTRGMYIPTALSPLCNVLLSYPLISLLGVNGANISVAVSLTVDIIVRGIMLGKRIGFKISLRTIGISVGVMVASSLAYLADNIILTVVSFVLTGLVMVWIYRKRITMLWSKVKGKITAG